MKDKVLISFVRCQHLFDLVGSALQLEEAFDLAELGLELLISHWPVHGPPCRVRVQIAWQKRQQRAAPHGRGAAPKPAPAASQCALVRLSVKHGLVQRMRVRTPHIEPFSRGSASLMFRDPC
jgi:hypothetical protein